MKKLTVISLVLLICVTACGPQAAPFECTDAIGCVTYGPDEPIRIATSLVISGPNTELGLDSQHGVEVAVELYGDLLDHKVEIQFEDDNFAADRQRAKAILQGIIDRGYRIKFNYPNGVALWTLDEELIDLMAEAGCYEMTLAFESGCQEVLSKIVKKPLNLEKARKITKYVRGKNFRTNAFYI